MSYESLTDLSEGTGQGKGNNGQGRGEGEGKRFCNMKALK